MNRFAAVVTALLAGSLASCSEKEAHGSGETKLELTAPASQSIRRGETHPVAIQIDRDGFEGSVEIAFSNLPRGVTVPVGGSIPAGESSREFVLAAAPDATVVANHPVTVTASARDMRVTQTFEVTIHTP